MNHLLESPPTIIDQHWQVNQLLMAGGIKKEKPFTLNISNSVLVLFHWEYCRNLLFDSLDKFQKRESYVFWIQQDIILLGLECWTKTKAPDVRSSLFLLSKQKGLVRIKVLPSEMRQLWICGGCGVRFATLLDCLW